ncbi:MAG TPA: phospholipid carrier-dependent glycosyltransferase [Anaerolineales bacterium]|nr:phospholipid carrier-dependent glycosyltransferase [Anaerolineales bacterium]
MTSRDSLRLASFLSLILLMVTGTFLVLRATPEGLGLSDDSIAYIAGARSLLEGNGYREAWLVTNSYVTHFPPGFSSALTFIGWFELDPLRGARFLNALLFGLNAGLLGILGWRMTPSLMAGLALAALFILNGDLLQVHTVAMSEPLFIFLSLLSFWMFDLYFELPPSSVGRGVAGEWWWLAACGVFAGLAYLTRYAGLALAATFLVAIVVLRSNWRKRFTSIGIFLAGFMPWVLIWALRNQIGAANATNRSFVWHPIAADNMEMGLRVFTDFLVPVASWHRAIMKQPGLAEAMAITILGAILIWVSAKAWKTIVKPRQAEALKQGGKESREVITFAVALFLFAYLASIVASMTMFDAATKFRLRILAPMFVSLLILLVYAGIWLSKRNRGVVIAFALIFLGFSFYEQTITVSTWAKGGIGYASFQWYDAEAMAYLRDLPADVLIYTNEPGAVYLYTGRGAAVVPSGYDSARAEFVPGFEEGVAYMQEEINAGRAVLALFDDGENIANEAGALRDGLYLAHRSAGDFIYTQQP